MTFTRKELNTLVHCLEVAKRDFEKYVDSSKPRDDEYSDYQIFKRQVQQAQELINKIDATEL